MNAEKPDIQEIFWTALDQQSAQELQEYLDRACGGDARLRAEVEELLDSHQVAGNFLRGCTCTDLFGGTDPLEGDASRTALSINDVPLDFLQPSQQPGSLGRLGQYEILEAVGCGGMGIVLKAQDTKLNRIVAVKTLAPELAANATARRRFLREAQAAAAVSHEHVVTIYAVEDNERFPYLVMEFIDGQSLQQKLDRQGPLEVKEILRIGRQIAAGLAAAHAQGLIHRDVKPSNILLQNGVERVQITDFGLARAADDVGMTRTGEVTGTPPYMSPEQAQGQPVDARSDLFSLGSVMYAMCTGRSPFRADTTVASLRRVCDDTPRPIREVNADIPDWLAAIIDRLLQKNPADRLQTSAEVADLLGKHLAHVQGPRSTPFPGTLAPARRRTRNWSAAAHRWVAAGLVLIAAVMTLGVTEATGVTHLSATVVRIVTGEGTLVIEVDDPSVQVSLDGEELSITGAGLQEVRLRPGQYQFQAIKDGQPLQSELVSIHRGDRQIVRVTREPDTSLVPETRQHFYCILEDGKLMSIQLAGRQIRTEEIGNLGSPFSDEDCYAEGLAMGPDHLLYAAVSMNMAPDPVWSEKGRSDIFSQTVPSRLYKIDPVSGVATLVGEMAYRQIDGLSFASDGALYGVVSVLGGGGAAELLKIDIRTAEAQAVGSPLGSRDLDALAIDSTGRAFAVSALVLSQRIIELDLAGVQNPVPHPIAPEYQAFCDAEGMAFGSDGNLFAVTSNLSHAGLYLIDLQRFGVHRIGPLPFVAYNLASDISK